MSATTTATPPVLVVLVTHDGIDWLPETLDALQAQTYPAIDVVAIDNASEDGSRELLLERLGEGRVLVADRDLGFPAAVSMALDARAAHVAPYVMLLHDDLVLDPASVTTLVEALEQDQRLAAVGSKLRAWGPSRELQSVGWTIDITGRADNGVDAGELDQGQRDQDRRALYVSTAGMMVRREVFESLGRFDPRYHVFRDDLDLCWRIWLTGHDVEVIPDAVGEHAGGAANYLRLGQTRHLGARYFAERNTLATLLKNYGPARLLGVVPLFFLVGIAKVLGFALTRRFSDAYQTIRAWAWNVLHVRETWRYRRRVQAARIRSDREIVELFGRIGPRVRAYTEAIASWIAGGDVDPAPEPSQQGPKPEPESVARRVAGLVRRRPTLVAGFGLVVRVLVGAAPLLLPGELRGGELAPWPAVPAAFLADYVAGWHAAGVFGTAEAPSPAQALLGFLHVATGGNEYLAPRVLLLAPLFVAWLLALRAAQIYSPRRPPRVVAATAYVLSPPALAALVTGRIGALVALAVLPGLVAGWITLARPQSDPARAWRAVAAVTLLGAIGGAFEPLVLAVLVAVGALVTAIGVGLATDAPWRIALLARAGVAVAGPVVLLLPWSLRLVGPDGLLTGSSSGEAVGDELWRWLLLAPGLDGFPGLLAGAGFVLAGVLGLAFGTRRSAGLVAALWTAALLGAAGGWWLDRSFATTWAGLPLLVTAAAFAGLFALAFATGERLLARHAFGWRQVAAGVTVVAVVVSIGTVAATLVSTPWETYAVDDPALPSFIDVEAAEEGPFRVLLLADDEGEVSWEVVDGKGPTMAAYGVPLPDPAVDRVEAVVDDLLAGLDPRALDRLGVMNVRYVLVPPGVTSPELSRALLAQTGAEPQPIPDGQLLEITGWLPRAAAVSERAADEIADLEAVPDGLVVDELDQRGPGEFRGELPDGASVLVTEVAEEGWRARVDNEVTRADAGDDLVRFGDLPGGQVLVDHEAAAARGLAVTGQLLAVLLAFSLALRPPSFARSHARELTASLDAPTGPSGSTPGPSVGGASSHERQPDGSDPRPEVTR